MNILNKIKSKRDKQPTSSTGIEHNSQASNLSVAEVRRPPAEIVEVPEREDSHRIVEPSKPPSRSLPKSVTTHLPNQRPQPPPSRPRPQSPKPVLLAPPRRSSAGRSSSNKKTVPPIALVDKHLSAKDKSSKNILFGTVLFWELLMDVYLLKLLNYDGRMLHLNVPEGDLEDIDDTQYLCVKGAVLYSCDDKEYASATKREIVAVLSREDIVS